MLFFDSTLFVGAQANVYLKKAIWLIANINNIIIYNNCHFGHNQRKCEWNRFVGTEKTPVK